MTKELEANEYVEVCLLDIPQHTLSSALSDPETATLVANFNESSILNKVDELFNLYETSTNTISVNKEAVSETRKEWTVEMTRVIFDKITSFGG